MIRPLICGLFGHDWRLAGAMDNRGHVGDLCAGCGLVRWGRDWVYGDATIAELPLVMKRLQSIPMSVDLAEELTWRCCDQCGVRLTPPERPGRQRPRS